MFEIDSEKLVKKKGTSYYDNLEYENFDLKLRIYHLNELIEKLQLSIADMTKNTTVLTNRFTINTGKRSKIFCLENFDPFST